LIQESTGIKSIPDPDRKRQELERNGNERSKQKKRVEQIGAESKRSLKSDPNRELPSQG